MNAGNLDVDFGNDFILVLSAIFSLNCSAIFTLGHLVGLGGSVGAAAAACHISHLTSTFTPVGFESRTTSPPTLLSGFAQVQSCQMRDHRLIFRRLYIKR